MNKIPREVTVFHHLTKYFYNLSMETRNFCYHLNLKRKIQNISICTKSTYSNMHNITAYTILLDKLRLSTLLYIQTEEINVLQYNSVTLVVFFHTSYLNWSEAMIIKWLIMLYTTHLMKC